MFSSYTEVSLMKKREIKINIAMKSLTSRGVKEYPFLLLNTPETYRELIEESVRSCIAAYRERAIASKNPTPLTDEEYREMSEIGKLAFGIHYNEAEINEGEAIAAAIEAVSDGIVRVFKGDEEMPDLDATLKINEGDVFAFIRLTMLSGRMW